MSAEILEQDATEIFTPTNIDSKGRRFGYVAGFRKVVGSEKTYAWVQRAIAEVDGTFTDFGPRQRSRPFPSIAAARSWAYSAIKQRRNRGA